MAITLKTTITSNPDLLEEQLEYIKQQLRQQWEELQKNGQLENKSLRVYLTKGKVVKRKTPQQLGYFFAVVLPMLCQETGFTQDEMLKVIYSKFAPRDAFFFGAEEVVHVKTFSGMNREEVSKVIDHTILWATEAGITIPPPVKEMPHDAYIMYQEAAEGRWQE